MKRTALPTALVSAAVLLIGISLQASRQAAQQIPSRHFELSYIVHVPALPQGSHQLRLWIPLPYQDAYQSVSHLRIESPVTYKIDHQPEYSDRYAYLTVSGVQARKSFDIKISSDVVRREHRVSLTPSSNPSSTPHVETARYLRPDRLVPINGQIAELSQEQTEGATLPLEKVRKIYNYVIASMHYDHEGTGWGHGDAIYACTAKHGNCTDFHSLFIAMARAAGIPARFEIGLPLPPGPAHADITSYHCWAEFYIKGIGWVPIDASEAWKHKEKINYFFGAIDTNRVMFSLGRDIRLSPAQAGDPLNYFVYSYAELDGKPFEDLKSDYSFRDTAAPAPVSHGAGAN
ncbi:MAG TPA: transglutaminase domain-containing protein [Verrucomicrobiae bacterium]|nr:transglutaminase domain-containing protein [Verrucomicrobiae bacterium]